MEKTKKEILDMMRTAKTWRELGLSIAEVYNVFSNDNEPEHPQPKSVVTITDESSIVKDLRDKIARLTDTNKQLRAENKALRGGAKK